jgi:prepilin-type N-terminal cleavage/methylation domain-containing protein
MMKDSTSARRMSSASEARPASADHECEWTRRAFTLLELLVALAILLTIAGITLPSMVRILAEREFESAGDVVVNHLLLARSHAQTSGEMVEVRFVADPPHLEARRFDPRVSDDESQVMFPARDEARVMPTLTRLDRSYDDEESARLIARGWAQRAMPGDVRITRTQPERDDLRYPDAYADEAYVPFLAEMEDAYAAAPGVEDDVPVFIRLAVFLPDGSALLADPVWLVDEDDRAAKLTVNPWTGLAELERLEDLLAEDPSLEEEPQEDESDDMEEVLDEAETFDDAPPSTSSESSSDPEAGASEPEEEEEDS